MVVAPTLIEEVVSQLVGAEAEVSGGGGLSEKIKLSILRTYLHMRRYLSCNRNLVLFLKIPLPSYFLISAHLFLDRTGVSALISTSKAIICSSSGDHNDLFNAFSVVLIEMVP